MRLIHTYIVYKYVHCLINEQIGVVTIVECPPTKAYQASVIPRRRKPHAKKHIKYMFHLNEATLLRRVNRRGFSIKNSPGFLSPLVKSKRKIDFRNVYTVQTTWTEFWAILTPSPYVDTFTK